MIELNERQKQIAEKYKSQALPGSAPTSGGLQLNERQMAIAQKYAPTAKAKTPSVSLPAPQPAVQRSVVHQPAVESPSYAAEMSRLEEVRRRAAVDLDTAAVADAESKMKVLRESAGKQTVGDRVSDVISGAFNDFGSAVVNTLGVANNAYNDPDFNRRQIATYTKVLEEGKTTDGKPLTMAMRLKIADRIVEMREQIREWESEDSATNKLYKTADTMKEKSEEQVASAKEGLGKAGQFAVDVGLGAAQLAGDIGANLLVPGAGLAAMGVRSFGGASQEARQNGATIGQQMAYGAGSAAASVLTEKLANVAGPFKKAFGGGVLDRTLSKISAKPAGKLVLSALSEGGEEALESVMQPVLQKLTYNPDAQYDEEWLAETLYSAAVGTVLGGLGGGVDVIGGGDTKAGKGDYKAVETGSVKAETGKAMEELGVQKAADRLSETPEGAVKATEAYGTTDATKQAQYRRAERIAKNFGAEFRVAALGTGSAGEYANGTITIDPTANNPVMQVLVHELTHHMEASGMYQQFSAMVERYIAEDMGADIAELKSGIMAEYAGGGFQLDEAGASRELVAKFAETKLFQDERAIKRLLKEDRTLFEKIRDWISDAMVKVRGTSEEKFLMNAQKLYEKALSSADRRETGFGPQQLYVGKTVDGTEVYETSKEVRALTWKERKKQFMDIMQNQYQGRTARFDVGGAVYYAKFDKKDLNKNIFGDNRSDASGRDAKINVGADGNIFDLVEHTTHKSSDSEQGKVAAAHKGVTGWEYFIKTVQIDNQVYDLLANVRKKPDGEYVYSIQLNENKKKPASPVAVFAKGDPASEWGTTGNVARELSRGVTVSGSLADTTSAASKPSVRESGTDVNVENTAPRYLLAATGKDAQQSYGRSFERLTGDVRHLKTAEQMLAERELEEGERTVLNKIAELYRTGRVTQEEYDAAVEYLLGDAEETEGTTVDTLPTKARKYLEGAEKALVARMANALSVPLSAQRDFLQGFAREMSEEYLRTGTVSQETTDRLFEEAYAAGIESETAFYEQYKDIKNHLRKQAVTISEVDSADIADYDAFRKSAFGTLRIVNEGGLGVDVAYQELQSMAPELFPADLIHPADQLMRMYEVGKSIRKTERTLDEYHGESAEEFKRWAKNDFEAALGDSMAELRRVKRYADEKAAQRAAEMAASPDAVRTAYKDIRNARKKAEKAVGRNLLTDYDNVQVGRLLKGEITLEDLAPEKVNIRGVKEVYEAKQEYERLSSIIRDYNTKRKAKLREEADADLATANDWDDKPAGILYSRETMERNIRDIVPDQETAKRIISKYFKPVHTAQAESTRTKNAYRDRVKALNLSRKKASGNEVSEAYAVQLVGEAQDNIRVLLESKGRMKARDGKSLKDWEAVLTDLWAKNPNLDRGKIEKAVAEFHSIYDELFQKMNEVRIRNGYEPIAYRQGYFPHFQADGAGDGILGQFGKALGIDTDVTALPTSINGLTHTFRPGITWFGAAQERKGFDTAYDAVQGFDKYIEGAADVIHQTDNIQRLRALASQMRYRTTDDGIRKQVDAVMENNALSEEDKQNRVEKIYESGRFALSNFVVELEEYTNLLANKKSRADRNMEQALGRNMYNIVKGLESRVAANMVAINPASWLTNFIPITQGAATVDTGTLMKAMGDTLKAYKADDGMVGRSSFLTNRRGSDPLVRTWAQGASAKLSKPMEWIDTFTADTLVRARYAQNIKRGLSEAEAVSEADSWAATVMADRSKGSMPTLFNRSNPITKLFTQFQLEVNNQFSYLFKDVPDELKKKGLAALGAGLLKFFVGAFLYNEVYEYVVGRRPALDPIGLLNDTAGDLTGYELPNLVEAGVGLARGEGVSFETEKKGTYEAVENLATAAAEELPFVGSLLGGGRVPISSALPDAKNLGKAVFSDTWDPKKKRATIVKELAAPATYLAAPFGGGQIKKIFQGIQAVRKGGSYSVDSSGREIMQYPVFNDTAADVAGATAKALLFGKSSLKTAKEWVEDDFDSYGAKQTAVYQGMNDAGVSDREAYALLEELRAIKKTDTESVDTIQRRVLRESDISPAGKTVAYYGLLASEKDVEVMDKLADTGADMGAVTDVLMAMRDANLMSGEKGKRAKYTALLDANLDDAAKLEIYRAAISDEKDNEIKSVMDEGLTLNDWVQFESDTVGLKSDDSGTKKEKVLLVIDGMDIDAEQKDALFLAAGYAESGLEDAPWNAVESKKYELAAPGRKELKLKKLQLKALELPKL